MEPHEKSPADGVAAIAASARRWWGLIAVLVVLFAAGGGVAGYSRDPTYTAESELTVGQASLSTQSLAGYADAVQNLAGIYSRLVTGVDVMGPAAERARVRPADLKDRTTAAPVPSSAIFRVSVDAPSAREALRQNRLVVSAAIAKIAELGNDGRADAMAARSRYYTASIRAARFRVRVDRLKRRRSTPLATLALLEARAAREQLDADAASQLFLSNANPTTQDFKGAQVVSAPSSTTNDRASSTQKLALAGAVVGFLVGLAVSTLLDRRRPRRTPATS